ncbi:hypothetical protein AYX15_07055 [Cryptococcus neoformans]|nr:hypothetical protein AYX15_07055 [Cryptococcus neoformans var. grubii]
MAFEGMMKKISLELVRARARTFAITLFMYPLSPPNPNP